MWPKKYFNIFADISTFCNAGCPQCHRTNPNGLKKVDWLPLIQWSLEQFKKAYPPKTLNITDTMQICGTWGDPLMNKDILEICKYIVDSSSCKIIINTNGSVRDEEFWWELGSYCRRQLTVVFGIDGKDQYQHQLYRKFTDLNKILDNMKTLSLTPSKIIAQTIVFEHNQNDIYTIRELCLKNGAGTHSFVWTDRFDTNSNRNGFEYTNSDGSSYTLQKATKNAKQSFNELEIKEKKDTKGCIECKWLKKREVVVNPDGQVLPCCYLANGYFMSGPPDFNNHELMLSYQEQSKSNNIFVRPLEEILADSKWFNHELPDSWNTDNPLRQCSKYCSSSGDFYNAQERIFT